MASDNATPTSNHGPASLMLGYSNAENGDMIAPRLDSATFRMLVSALTVTEPSTSGGLSIFRSIDLDETEEAVKASAGQIYGYYIYNNAATTHFIKFYNATVANVTVGTTTPVLTIPLPPGAAANAYSDIGIEFDTAITVAATTGIADNDTGTPAVNAVTINVLFS